MSPLMMLLVLLAAAVLAAALFAGNAAVRRSIRRDELAARDGELPPLMPDDDEHQP